MNTEELEKETIAALVAYVTENVSAIDREERFDEMLNECYSFEKVGGPFAHMTPAGVLFQMDPIAYRCGVSDYFGNDDSIFEIKDDYYDRDEVEKVREEFVETLESDLADAELWAALEAEAGTEDSDETEACETLRAKIEIARNYTF